MEKIKTGILIFIAVLPIYAKITGITEIGFLGVMSHKIQFGDNGTYFNYRRDGGQENLYQVFRFSLEYELNPKHTFILLYQPLKLETQALLSTDLIVDDLLFPAGTPMSFLYSFPFYRISWLREFRKADDDFKIAVGLSFQIRNATIEFRSLDGDLFRTEKDVGPVPALKLRTSYDITKSFWIGLEVDGMYAPVSYLNGSDEEIVGAIVDASLRTGINLKIPGKIFINGRYLGGGAVGTNSDDTGPGDGYVKNWLHFFTITVGLSYSLGL